MMGTKNNPGTFDCYAKAEPDEPMFILLGRDKYAPVLVALWVNLRAADGATELAQVEEALALSQEMLQYRRERQQRKPKAEFT